MGGPIEPGDFVVRIKVPVVPYLSPSIGVNGGRPDDGTNVGKVYRVLDVVGPVCGHMGLILEGYPSHHPTRAWPAIAYRKIDQHVDETQAQTSEVVPA